MEEDSTVFRSFRKEFSETFQEAVKRVSNYTAVGVSQVLYVTTYRQIHVLKFETG